MAPGAAVTFPVRITSATETIVAGSPLLHFRYDGGAYATRPLASLGGNDYQATLPPPVCGATPEFYVTAIGSVSGNGRELQYAIGAAQPDHGAPMTIQIGDARQITIAYETSPGASALGWMEPAQTSSGK